MSSKNEKKSRPIHKKVAKGKYDNNIIELFVSLNLDLMDFVSGPFRGRRSIFACLAIHIGLDYKNQKVLRELYNILVFNKRYIRDKIIKKQEELLLPPDKGKLPEIQFSDEYLQEPKDQKEDHFGRTHPPNIDDRASNFLIQPIKLQDQIKPKTSIEQYLIENTTLAILQSLASLDKEQDSRDKESNSKNSKNLEGASVKKTKNSALKKQSFHSNDDDEDDYYGRDIFNVKRSIKSSSTGRSIQNEKLSPVRQHGTDDNRLTVNNKSTNQDDNKRNTKLPPDSMNGRSLKPSIVKHHPSNNIQDKSDKLFKKMDSFRKLISRKSTNSLNYLFASNRPSVESTVAIRPVGLPMQQKFNDDFSRQRNKESVRLYDTNEADKLLFKGATEKDINKPISFRNSGNKPFSEIFNKDLMRNYGSKDSSVDHIFSEDITGNTSEVKNYDPQRDGEFYPRVRKPKRRKKTKRKKKQSQVIQADKESTSMKDVMFNNQQTMSEPKAEGVPLRIGQLLALKGFEEPSVAFLNEQPYRTRFNLTRMRKIIGDNCENFLNKMQKFISEIQKKIHFNYQSDSKREMGSHYNLKDKLIQELKSSQEVIDKSRLLIAQIQKFRENTSDDSTDSISNSGDTIHNNLIANMSEFD